MKSTLPLFIVGLLSLLTLLSCQSEKLKTADDYYLNGKSLYEKEDYRSALNEFSKAIALNADHVDAYYHRGRVYEYLGNHDGAIADYSMVIDNNPRDATAYVSRAVVWQQKKDYENTIADASIAVQINPESTKAYFIRGLARQHLKDYRMAIDDYKMTIGLDDSYYLAHNNLAWIYATCSDPEFRNGLRAVKSAKRAFELAGNTITMDTMAAAYAENGNFKSAVAVQTALVELLEKQGDTAFAREATHRLNFYKEAQPWREGT